MKTLEAVPTPADTHEAPEAHPHTEAHADSHDESHKEAARKAEEERMARIAKLRQDLNPPKHENPAWQRTQVEELVHHNLERAKHEYEHAKEHKKHADKELELINTQLETVSTELERLISEIGAETNGENATRIGIQSEKVEKEKNKLLEKKEDAKHSKEKADEHYEHAKDAKEKCEKVEVEINKETDPDKRRGLALGMSEFFNHHGHGGHDHPEKTYWQKHNETYKALALFGGGGLFGAIGSYINLVYKVLTGKSSGGDHKPAKSAGGGGGHGH